ncbi:alpha/beta fold hydrolase [Pseudobdellovibrio exovorus]|uniref:AB hydrolase-1 domain-containing protein n=1 Tax=Pseudobdellovibrio exovorus JSS TaxID=1184267 RepID=M4VBS0_9BACT|nr:alpha/beta hydrolase [Pseudobdellovibrio exovorus]AGH95935.1 hypothetical protein A11Q_1719 [Pseudobdellovibrio exovorus JSS]
MSAITHDHWIQTPKGKLFARSVSTEAAPVASELAPIVLFHDSLGCVQLWRSFPELLSHKSKRTVIAYDRLGFGQSDAYEEEPHTDFIQEEAAYFFPYVREQLNLQQFVAFGHSVGGAMAASCAAYVSTQSEESCVAVITESTQAFVEQLTLEGISAAKTSFSNPSELSRLQKYHGSKTERVLRAWTDIWLSAEFSTWNLKEVLSQVNCPLLAIHGDRDEYGSLQFPEMITQWSGGSSKKLIINDCGHVPHREKTDEILSAVEEFLKEKK